MTIKYIFIYYLESRNIYLYLLRKLTTDNDIMVKSRPVLHSGRMEVAIANLINYRSHVIVPNVSWGLHLNHECDLLVMDGSGRFTEVEIKVSKSDLLADFKKRHGHVSKYISRLVYGVPDSMVDFALGVIPESSGLISVYYHENSGKYLAKWVRRARHNRMVGVPDRSIVNKFLELGIMRIWGLKQRLYEVRR